ncbi:unnamed protein product [Mytilus edulis]|uniref:SMB domain-containing protein n=1 Tax=Mytilus edulis TaxID=6550 RepID=A0A8S3QCK0_MYTED|nr:unnamed protein product [Mytilus edulis]
MLRYSSICGHHSCSSSEKNRSALVMGKFGLCPLCSCNTRCIQYGNCCPEVFYALNISCVNPGILEGEWWNEDNRYPVSINRYKNSSGLWHPYDPELEKLCAETPITQVIGNFKNIYCYFCNRNNDQTTQYNFIDVMYEADRYSHFRHLFKIKKFNLKYILYTLVRKIDDEYSSYVNESLVHFLTTPLNDFLNSSHVDLYKDELLDIYNKYLAYSGRELFCENYSTFTELENCDCDVHCSIRHRSYNKPCCIDKMIERSKTCTLDKYSLKRKTYIVYDDCSNFPQSRLHMLCKQNSNQDLLNILPVTLIKDDIPFKNIFCFL